MLSKLKSKYFPKGYRKTYQRYADRLLHRASRRKLKRAVKELQIPDSSPICIHSMLSGLGYLPDGPASVLHAVQEAVPNATLMMPTFPFSGTTEAYLAGNPIYDRQTTPSRSGLLSETLRLESGALRSFHPTHPCCALGPRAAELIVDSEQAVTPFGDSSTYGRFCAMDDAHLLLIHTNNSSIVHRVQELVEIPNLFLNGWFQAQGKDQTGTIKTYDLKIHRPTIPLYVVMHGDGPGLEEYLWLPDYAFLFPDYNKQRIMSKLVSQRAKNLLQDRHKTFLQQGIYRRTNLNGAEIWVVEVKGWLERICQDLQTSLADFPDQYSLTNMQNTMQAGLLHKFALPKE